MFLKIHGWKCGEKKILGYVAILNSFGVHLQCSVTLTVELNISQLLNTTRGNSTQKIISLSSESMTSWCHSHWSRCLTGIQRCFHCVTCAKQYCLPSHGGARWPPEQTGSLPSLCCWKFQIHERRKQSDLEMEPSYFRCNIVWVDILWPPSGRWSTATFSIVCFRLLPAVAAPMLNREAR